MIPDAALVVLVGASGSGKSTWARERYRAEEIVSSDDLRGVVGSGRHDLDASTDAFALLDAIVDARTRRGLTCVVDTLGLDPGRRRGYLDAARRHGRRAVAVRFDVPPALARERNAARDRPVPARALAAQLRRSAEAAGELDGEGWDDVHVVTADAPPRPRTAPVQAPSPARGEGPQLVLHVSRFPWGSDPAGWLRDVALAAHESGFAGLSLMDHLIQIPQVERAWEPIPEPWTALALLAGLDTSLRLGTLVSPVTFRPAGVLAKTVATLDALTGGRAFLGLGAGWWEREHAGFGLPFPPAGDRLDALAEAIPRIRALLAPGTKAAAGLPETTCYPRPAHDVPIVVGGSGARTLRIAATLADACNVPSDEERLATRIETVRRHAGERDVAVTVLDLPVTGADRDEVWARVERHRGRASAAAFARTHHAGPHAEHRARYERLADAGVRTVFVAPVHLRGADDVLALRPIVPA